MTDPINGAIAAVEQQSKGVALTIHIKGKSRMVEIPIVVPADLTWEEACAIVREVSTFPAMLAQRNPASRLMLPVGVKVARG